MAIEGFFKSIKLNISFDLLAKICVKICGKINLHEFAIKTCETCALIRAICGNAFRFLSLLQGPGFGVLVYGFMLVYYENKKP